MLSSFLLMAWWVWRGGFPLRSYRPPTLHCVRIEGGCYFFTVALANRKLRLLIENIESLRQAVECLNQNLQNFRIFRMGLFMLLGFILLILKFKNEFCHLISLIV
jgi:hypothetical protein